MTSTSLDFIRHYQLTIKNNMEEERDDVVEETTEEELDEEELDEEELEEEDEE